MPEKHNPLKPYSFFGRIIVVLTVCIISSTLISFVFAYKYSESDMRSEFAAEQGAVAVYLLELQQKTNLPIEVLARMAVTENTNIAIVDAIPLTVEQHRELEAHRVLTIMDEEQSTPVTYVLANGTAVRITVSPRLNVFLMTVLRFVFASGTFVAVFMLMSVLASRVIATPVSDMTKAMRRVGQGDFTVRLPEKSTGELGELQRTFNGMTAALDKNLYLQKDFISNISHEFRTPISSIKGYARLLQIPGLDEETRAEYVQMIAHESDRLSNLSQTLLRLTSLEHHMTPATLTSFSLDEQIRQVILRLAPLWESRNFDWQLDGMNSVTITSDQELINQVWVNLIQNAIKFSEDGGSITISVYQTDMAVVEITDTGIGMTEETVSRIFDKFYQGDTSRSGEGSGLGLSLVKRIVDILGGSIKVRSAVGQGSTFRVRLPLALQNSILEVKHNGGQREATAPDAANG